jgi:hypothetical protein
MPRSSLAGIFALVGSFAAASAWADATTGSISGTITAASSAQPVSGVVVTASWLFFAPHVVKTTTDANGHYELDGLSPGFSYSVVAKPGENFATLGWPDQDCFSNIFSAGDLYWYYCSVGSAVAVTAGLVTTGIDFVLPSAGIVAGHVTRSDTSMPVPGATVWFDGHTTDANGYFHIGSVPPGQYGISVSADGLLTRFNDGQQCDVFLDCGTISASPVDVAANATTTLDFALDPGVSIGGHVHVAGGTVPVSGYSYITRIYNESDPQRPYVEAYADSNGAYEQTNLIPRSYSVRFGDPSDTRFVSQYFTGVPCVQDPCDLSGITVFEPLPGQSIVANATIQSRQHVSGRVVEIGTQAPIAGATVQAAEVYSIGWFTQWVTLSQGQTLADGTFTLAGIPAGTPFSLHTTAAGYIGLRNLDVICDQNTSFCSGVGGPLPFQVGLEQSLELGDLALTKGARITGRVINSDNGTALAHAWVEIYNEGVSVETLQPDSDGYYSTPPLSPGSVKLLGESMTHAQMYDHVDCAGACDLGMATPITVSGTDVIGGVDFAVSDADALFSSGFGGGPE